MKEVADGIRANLDEVQSLFSNEELLAKKIASVSHAESKVISWSKTNAFSIIPFYNELTGFKTGEMLSKEPKNKSNAYCYFSNDDLVNKVDSYNSKGVVADTSHVIRDDDEIFEIRQDVKGNYLAISRVFLNSQGQPSKAFFANDDGNVSGYHYFYKDGRIDSILTVSNHSPLPYVILSCVYDGGKISEIYFNNDKGKVVIYPR
ncbi:hypothetical protein [Serratia ficaria]|uniref:hypothetical protein n=1 Tax=Serratia ficaria TaxID=61651 RepID=UPI0021BB0986|nr:hypothetical protein [Serratia ficaria]